MIRCKYTGDHDFEFVLERGGNKPDVVLKRFRGAKENFMKYDKIAEIASQTVDLNSYEKSILGDLIDETDFIQG